MNALEELRRRLDRGEYVELIDGSIVEDPMRTPLHGLVHTRLSAALGAFDWSDRTLAPWWIATSVEILYPRTTEVLRHDVVGFRRALHPTVPAEHPVEARPDWACEILSPSTARYDVVQKQRTLHAHSVPHYWIIDPEHQTLTVMRWNEGHYLRVLDAGVGDVVRAEPFDAIELDVRELFGVEDDAP